MAARVIRPGRPVGVLDAIVMVDISVSSPSGDPPRTVEP